MSQLIMMFLFPIGLYFYLVHERKYRPEYQKVFDDFGAKISADSTLSDAQKKERYIQMLKHNGYTIAASTETKVKGEKRVLSMSLLAMGVGAYFVGTLVCLAYFFWVQKPHVVEYEV